MENDIKNKINENTVNTDTSIKDAQQLRSFAKITVEKLLKIILSGNSKSCSLDPMPTSFIKGLLPEGGHC